LDTIQKGGTVQLNIANSLWPQKNYPFHQIGRYSVPSTFLDSYLDLCKKYYGVTITPVDYKGNKEAACQTINQWVEEQTQRKITDLIRPEALNSQTRLMLVNAIYFKGRWSSQFQPGATSEEVFHVTPRQDAKCQMMFQQKTFEYAETTDLQMLKLPYVSNDLFMLILLPKKTDGIGALENNLSAEKLTEWIGSLKDQEVEVQLPKFTQTSTFSLAETLKNLGMTLAFEDKADFSGMDGHTHWLFISAVAHKAYVDVNEGGTEAAAATAVEMEAGAEAPREVPVFQADHPFIFLIMDKNTGSLLFMGRVITPAVY
jgi:serpin B